MTSTATAAHLADAHARLDAAIDGLTVDQLVAFGTYRANF